MLPTDRPWGYYQGRDGGCCAGCGKPAGNTHKSGCLTQSVDAALSEVVGALQEIARKAHDFDQLGDAHDNRFAEVEELARAALASVERLGRG